MTPDLFVSLFNSALVAGFGAWIGIQTVEHKKLLAEHSVKLEMIAKQQGRK